MFTQIDDPSAAVKKTRNEWLVEVVIILSVVATALGTIFYALY